MRVPNYLKIKQQIADDVAEICIDGEITGQGDPNGTSAVAFRDALKQIGEVKQINLHINSPGGNVFEGIAIYNMLKQNKAKVNVYIDALAASIASVIAMSGDAIFMPENSMLMIHNPYEGVIGNAKQLRKEADTMDRITELSVKAYLAKAGNKLDKATVQHLMDEESWLSAEEAQTYGLADEILPANQAIASINDPFAQHFKHIPKQLAIGPKEDGNQPKPVASNNQPVEPKEELDFKAIAEQAQLHSQHISNQLETLKEKLQNEFI